MATQIRAAIIDDHPMIRDGVVLALSNTRDIVVVADGSTGADATTIASRLLPDVMLLDINLPGGGGFEAAKAIRDATPGVRIIILTASERDADLATALDMGVAGYLLKGSGAIEIVHAVRSVYSGSSYVSPVLAARMLTRLNRRNKSPAEEGMDELTRRENKIITMVANGMTNQEVADALNLSVKTVKHHMTSVMQKLQVKNRLEAALKFRNLERNNT